MSEDTFKSKLDQNHEWPSIYMFKFIVPAAKEQDVIALFPKNELKKKASKNGKYVSITAEVMMGSSDDVMRKYREAHEIKGLVAL